jgi:hypothetical protein
MRRSYIYRRKEQKKEALLKARKTNKMVTFICTRKDEKSYDFMMKVAKPLWLDKRFIADDVIQYDAIVDNYGSSVIANWFE